MAIRTIIDNLSKYQKFGLLLMGQVIIIIILVSVVQIFVTDKQHVEVEDGNNVEKSIPADVKDFVGDNIWQLVQAKVGDLTQNDIKDVVVREGTYEEVENADGSVSVSFIVDIDSLKQTYVVETGWSKDKRTVYEVIVDCPPVDQMKYPETVCHGMYNDTYSLDLYLPYAVYPDGYSADSDYPMAPNYIIHGDESTKTIEIEVSICDPDRFKKNALKYLSDTPINLSDYTIKYNINNVDVEC